MIHIAAGDTVEFTSDITNLTYRGEVEGFMGDLVQVLLPDGRRLLPKRKTVSLISPFADQFKDLLG